MKTRIRPIRMIGPRRRNLRPAATPAAAASSTSAIGWRSSGIVWTAVSVRPGSRPTERPPSIRTPVSIPMTKSTQAATNGVSPKSRVICSGVVVERRLLGERRQVGVTVVLDQSGRQRRTWRRRGAQRSPEILCTRRIASPSRGHRARSTRARAARATRRPPEGVGGPRCEPARRRRAHRAPTAVPSTSWWSSWSNPLVRVSSRYPSSIVGSTSSAAGGGSPTCRTWPSDVIHELTLPGVPSPSR